MQSKPKSYHLPKHWIKSIHNYSLINDHILVCKVRLVSIIQNRRRSIQSTLLHGNDSYGRRRTFSTPQDLLDAASRLGKEIGMVLDLTMAESFYDGEKEFGQKGVRME